MLTRWNYATCRARASKLCTRVHAHRRAIDKLLQGTLRSKNLTQKPSVRVPAHSYTDDYLFFPSDHCLANRCPAARHRHFRRRLRSRDYAHAKDSASKSERDEARVSIFHSKQKLNERLRLEFNSECKHGCRCAAEILAPVRDDR